ncbi:MAG: CAP domain-containing protein [Propionibacteriaceae bacterium]
MVSNRLTRRLASAAVMVVAAVLPAALAHSADVAAPLVPTTPPAVVTPYIALVTASSPAAVSYDPQTPPKAGLPSAAVATPTVAPSAAAPTEAAKAAAAPSSKTSVAAKTVATTKTPVRAATPKPATTAPAPAATAPPATSGGVTARQDLATAVAAATNAQRTAAGLKALTIKTCSVPASFAVKLATEGALYHNNLYTVLGGCGGGSTAGENIARGYSSVSGVTAGWMGSAGHRANILNPSYTSIFVGVAQASNGTYYWVENFTG